MASFHLQEAQIHFPELIEKVVRGEEVIILRDNKPVAKIVPEPSLPRPQRKLGQQAGVVLYMAPDFDAPLEEFKEDTK
jgi:prevent-host-death family protein